MSGPQRRTTWDELCRTPILLIPVESRKPWGAETWLNATQPDGPAWVANAPEPITLLDLVRREPQILGQWAHLIFGDDQPVFTKIIRTHFPPFIHMGFRRKVALDAYRDQLMREHDLLRALYGLLACQTSTAFKQFAHIYGTWAMRQALHQWRPGAQRKIEALVRALRPFASERAELSGAPVADFDAAARATLTALCDTRAAIVAALHEVDLHQEQGHLLLCGTGVLHSIFGLSHQTHPHDATREPLSRLFAQLARAVKRGAEDEEIEALIQAVDLPLHRARNASAPKNEAWLPLATRAGMVLIEPQQTANCTYSLADFYTPFAWKNGRMIFRKGQPDLGLTHADLVGTLQEVSFAATPLARMRMRPVAVPLSACDAPGATLSRLIDDPVAWPFFTLHQLDLAGGRGRESRFLGDHPEGAFQQIVVLSGRVYLQDAQGQRLTLTPGTPVFIPASMKGGYLLAARERARVLLQSVPVPRGNTPASASTRVAPRFLKTAPVPLTFGTSGLRGLVKDITDIEAYINTCGFLRFLMATTGLRRGSRVAIAGDLRPSTGRILLAVARAILDNGLRIDHLGRIPTPALTHYAMGERIASVMVTGSHIPFDRNGIKFIKADGEVLKNDEAGILREVARVRSREYAKAGDETIFSATGRIKPRFRPRLPQVNAAAARAYVARYVSVFPAHGLAGLRVVVYQHSAVGRDLLTQILRELGATVVPAERSTRFIAIDTENVTDEQLAALTAVVERIEARSGPVNALVSTDGDSDRPLVIAVASRDADRPATARLRFFGGDLLGLVVALYLQADRVAVPVSASTAVDIGLGARGVRLVRTRIGSPFVIEAMQKLRGGRRIVGWEANGGFLTGSDILLRGRRLRALPTRDALLPILACLFTAVERKTSVAQLLASLPPRFSKAGMVDHVPVVVGRRILARFQPDDATLQELEYRAQEIVLRRGAGAAEIVAADATAAREALAIRARLNALFTARDGFGEIVRVNVLDGIRVAFDSGDIAHIRPSGNAPQLRIYANSDSQARADAIVRAGLREPDGILARLIAQCTSD